jgi:DNA invertase Pin-like site-specific DNA recombinase
VARPGFERLVAWLCAGEVGAVLCFDASRLARNCYSACNLDPLSWGIGVQN